MTGEAIMNSGVPGYTPRMSLRIFKRFSSYIETELGIKMPSVKLSMLQSRLTKRLRDIGCSSFEEYYDYVFSPKGINNELPNMIDAITTNKTDFFREIKHFKYLVSTVLPELADSGKNIKIWSAGCSSGEEPYTLAMVLSEFFKESSKPDFSIMATDISSRVLKKAMLGIYTVDQIEPVPMALRKKYLLRGRNKEFGFVKIKPFIKSFIRFGRLNFLDRDYGIDKGLDIIFCRNVIIYFDRSTQERVIRQLCTYLKPEGYLFLGHSETLTSQNLPLYQVAPTIYKKRQDIFALY